MPEKSFIALVGPSGSGKSAIIRFLTAFYPDEFAVPRSVTSRPRREGEGDGEYQFVSEDEFDRLVRKGAFLEHSVYAGRRYGLLKSAIEEITASGKTAVRAMDFPGAVNAGAFSVFVDRRTDDLLASILSRDIADAEIVRRLRQIPGERANSQKCDMSIRNDGRIRDAAFQVRGLVSGRTETVLHGTLMRTGEDGTKTPMPFAIDLDSECVWPKPENPAVCLPVDETAETLLVRGLSFQIRRIRRVGLATARDKVEFIGKSPDFP